ncbi:MAG: extracellular solute-binding protein [Rhizobiaceae bacterium]|nr:extracellular solute-binding protein [Rhizobiaceae bacterium]
MNRRNIILSTAAALAATTMLTLSAGLTAAQAQEIRVLNWNGYGTDEKFAVEKFKEMTGVTVVHDYYTSEQEMLTKMRTSPGAYDVVVVGTPFLPAARDEGLIEPVDTSKISNFGDISAQFKDSEIVKVGDQTWGVPWVWGINSFAYNTETIKEKITSVNALWDPKYAGRVALRDDGIYNVQMAALALGQDMNHPEDMAAIKEKLLALKPQIRVFWASEDEWMKGMAAKNFDMGEIWAGGAARALKRHKLPIDFVIPEEGASAWFDVMMIAKDAPNKEAAEKFIDYMVSPDFYITWDTTAGAAVSANAKAVAGLPEDAFNRTVMGRPDVLSRLKFAVPLTEDERQVIADMWAEVKTEYAQ